MARPLLVTIVEAAQMLGIGRSKAYELVNAGELPVVRIGRAVRVPTEFVERYVERLAKGLE